MAIAVSTPMGTNETKGKKSLTIQRHIENGRKGKSNVLTANKLFH